MEKLLYEYQSRIDHANSETGVSSHCCFCSMQCAIELRVETASSRISGIQPIKDFPVASGKACPKGIVAHEHARHRERLTMPLLRKGGELTMVSWEEALSAVADRIRTIQQRYGSDAFAVFGGGSLTNEKAYLLGKFARVALRTKNIDYNGRYCMSSAATAMNKVFGVDRGMTVPLSDIPLAKLILIVGANIADCQPTMLPYLRQAQKNGAKIVVVDPRKTTTAKMADLHVAIKPGTDSALMNGILHVMVEEDLIDSSFIAERTVGFEEVADAVRSYTPAKTAQLTDVPAEDIVQIARWYGTAETALLLTARGIEQQARGVNNVISCLNLVLASGKIGKPGCGYGAVTGQGNGQGGREHGQKADQLPGYRLIENPEDRAYIASVWGIDECELPGKGKSAYELFEDMAKGEIKGLFVLASNPVTSSPNSSFVKKAVAGLDTLVVVDLFLTETAKMADIVLPGSAWTEDEGTMTNLEGRVIVRRAAQKPPGQARLDWRILADLAKLLGKERFFSYDSTEDIFEELRLASAGGKADYSGITYSKIEQQRGVFWPCPSDDHPGTERMFTERFAHSHGKAVFYPVQFEPPKEMPDEEYPYTLTTGRLMIHYLTGVQTRRTVLLNSRQPAPYVEMHPQTAAASQVEDGERVELVTRRGSAKFKVKVTTAIRPDTLFVPMHWEEEQSVNLLTLAELDPESRMPEFKLCAVSIKKINSKAEGERTHELEKIGLGR
ncbi:molybdopterin oxidoreductase family protein [Effusibacillus lacus]|uniref:Nitrite reductase n=1 Tax=Effusibacillus lacus TaxID=1348429 RepID=A0A292YSG0_9BACL|nr:nitrate reductase [Effusibacillus lacus]TCS76075.1 assimilatory nitrate reductase (NADH) alpha subunit apoprotein [Effusibacillus lacus]GAX91410.1 nitrite reductase [Effusibacillus lacus]